jgi:hypothetical protein
MIYNNVHVLRLTVKIVSCNKIIINKIVINQDLQNILEKTSINHWRIHWVIIQHHRIMNKIFFEEVE